MRKHTPGPWKVSFRQIRGKHDVLIGVCSQFHKTPEGQANIHLIEAAPDMLDGLEYIVKEADRSLKKAQPSKEQENTLRFIRDYAQGLIDKAEGR